jgi:hypothetical protein
MSVSYCTEVSLFLWYFLIIQPTRCTNFSNLFWKWNLHISDSSSAHRQELFTVHSAMVYVIQVPSWSCCSKAVYRPLWHIPSLSVQWITPGDGQRNCLKHVEFHFENKFEKLLHLVGFVIRKFVTMHGHMNVKFCDILRLIDPLSHLGMNIKITLP